LTYFDLCPSGRKVQSELAEGEAENASARRSPESAPPRPPHPVGYPARDTGWAKALDRNFENSLRSEAFRSHAVRRNCSAISAAGTAGVPRRLAARLRIGSSHVAWPPFTPASATGRSISRYWGLGIASNAFR
jgi:hypothetical protein